MKHAVLIAIYLAAIVTANLLVVAFGPAISIINAFVLIGLDLTVRDRLHDGWHDDRLVWRMALLIASGGALSYLINRAAGGIALASTSAFIVSSAVDSLVYAGLARYPKLAQVNGSNVAGAATDSFLFPLLAFGLPLLWLVVIGQFLAKLAGGVLWSLLLYPRRRSIRADLS